MVSETAAVRPENLDEGVISTPSDQKEQRPSKHTPEAMRAALSLLIMSAPLLE